MNHDTYSFICAMPSPPPSPNTARPDRTCAITDLSHQMKNHSLETHPSIPISPSLSTPPNELSDCPTWSVFSSTSPFASPAFSDLSFPVSSVDSEPLTRSRSRSPPLSYPNYHSHNVRRSRQDAVRAQCSSSHLHEISMLVARMVESGEQCNVCAPDDVAPRVHCLSEEPAQMEPGMDLENSEDEQDMQRPLSSGSHPKGSHMTHGSSRRTSSGGSGSSRDPHYCVTKQRPGLARKVTRKKTA